MPQPESALQAVHVIEQLSEAESALGAAEIARREGLPLSAAVEILEGLARAGLLERDAGGYRLTRNPGDIPFAEVRAAFEGSAAGPGVFPAGLMMGDLLDWRAQPFEADTIAESA